MNPVNSPTAFALERYRLFLEQVAKKEQSSRDCADVPGVVQQTLLEAHQSPEQLAQLDESRRLTWLRTALVNNLADEARRQTQQKRDAGRAQSPDATTDAPPPATEQTSPSAAAARSEDARRLSEALALLPESERQAVVLHHLDRLTVAAVAQRMDRTKLAVVGLLHRGLSTLRDLMNEG
jgi:RNA polymerase sigma-70 factor (ECF subfamily)